jgi:hypothetical protein
MALDVEKQLSARKITMYDFDPGATSLTDIGWVDMKGYEGLLVSFFRTIGTSTVVLKIIANSASDGTGDEAVIATKTFTAGQPDAVGDYVFLECLASQIAQASSDNGYNLRYASAQVSVATGTDEGVVTYIQDKPRFKYSALTADYIS